MRLFQQILTRPPHASMLPHLRHAVGAALFLAVLPATLCATAPSLRPALAFAPSGAPSLRFSGAFLAQQLVSVFNPGDHLSNALASSLLAR